MPRERAGSGLVRHALHDAGHVLRLIVLIGGFIFGLVVEVSTPLEVEHRNADRHQGEQYRKAENEIEAGSDATLSAIRR